MDLSGLHSLRMTEEYMEANREWYEAEVDKLEGKAEW